MTETPKRTDDSAAEAAGPIIELTQRIQPPDLDPEGPVIELITPIQSPSRQTPPAVAAMPVDFPDAGLTLDEEAGEDLETDDFVDSLGIEITPIEPPPPESAGAPSAALFETESPNALDAAPVLTAERIEAALERVVERVYAEKIQGILVEVIERVVNREIERLRSRITGEADSDV